MRKLFRRMAAIALVVSCALLGMLIADRKRLEQDLIRLHVVAASDSTEDQAVKLQVRDALIANLDEQLKNLTDVDQAKAYIQQYIPQLESIANQVLDQVGSTDRARIRLTEEEFPLREYETFSLPAGVYQSLRVIIGDGEGQNWWCVVFPGLCYSATADGVEEMAVSAGFSDELANTLTLEDGYELRFFLLDCLGRVENFFHRG